MRTVTVGAFMVTEEDGGRISVLGPSGYLDSHGTVRLAAIAKGQDPVFEFGSRQQGADMLALIGVSLQTDYAAYLGQQGLRWGKVV